MGSSENTGRIGFFGLLGLIFITLKLTHVIAWSWWYVLMPLYLPLYLPLALVLAFLLIALVVMIVAQVLE